MGALLVADLADLGLLVDFSSFYEISGNLLRDALSFDLALPLKACLCLKMDDWPMTTHRSLPGTSWSFEETSGMS